MSKAKRRQAPKPTFWQRHRGDIFTAVILIPLALLAIWVWSGHLRLDENANASAVESSATNPIGIQTSSHPTDTDIAGIQAAEAGQQNEPALVWFHADW